MISMTMDEDLLFEIDRYYRKAGFHSRSDFIRFSCSQIMEQYQNKNLLAVEKNFHDYIQQSLKNKIADNIIQSLNINAESIKKELMDTVYKGTLKKILESEAIEK